MFKTPELQTTSKEVLSKRIQDMVDELTDDVCRMFNLDKVPGSDLLGSILELKDWDESTMDAIWKEYKQSVPAEDYGPSWMVTYFEYLLAAAVRAGDIKIDFWMHKENVTPECFDEYGDVNLHSDTYVEGDGQTVYICLLNKANKAKGSLTLKG
jgi:hypothetical protein